MGGFSIWHILIIAIILLLVFGGNRFSSMMGDVAKGLKSFKQGMADEEDEKIPPLRRAAPQRAAAPAAARRGAARTDRRDAASRGARRCRRRAETTKPAKLT